MRIVYNNTNECFYSQSIPTPNISRFDAWPATEQSGKYTDGVKLKIQHPDIFLLVGPEQRLLYN